MKQLMAQLKKLLSGRNASLLIIAVCILLKSVLICYYSYIGRDKMYHLSASLNLLEGKGWTNSVYYTDQPDKEVLEPFCLWPPGYGMLITSAKFISGGGLHFVINFVEILSFAVFLLLCRGLLRSQQMSRGWVNISTIALTFFPHEFIEISLGTDLPGLCWMLGYFYATVLIWNNPDPKRNSWLGIAAALCLFMAGYTRYMYVPVAVFIAIAMLLIAYWKKRQTAFRGFWLTLILSSVLLLLAAWYQGYVCADPFYIGTEKKSFFLSNLSYWHPAVLSAFTNPDVSCTVLQKVTGISFLTWRSVLSLVNLLVYLCLAIMIIRSAIRLIRKQDKGFSVFDVVGTLLSVAIIGELALLSLTNSPKYELYGRGWTFIMESRYHAFVIVFVQLFFFLTLSRISNRKETGRFKRLLIVCIATVFSLNLMQQVRFTSKVVFNYSGMKREVYREADYVFAEELLLQMKKENRQKDIFVASSDMYYPFIATAYGEKGIKDYNNVHLLKNRVERPSDLIVVIMKPQLMQFRSFLEQPDVRLLKEINGTYIYLQTLRP
jgi:hypothetical protein